jgi:hypothetical protein
MDYAWQIEGTGRKQIDSYVESNQGFFFIDKHNEAVFYERTAKDTARTGHSWTLNEDALTDIVVDTPWANVVNRVRVMASAWTAGGSATLWTLTDAFYLGPGETKILYVTLSAPTKSQSVVAVANAQADGGGTNMTDDLQVSWASPAYGATITIRNTNTTTGLWVTSITLNGSTLTVQKAAVTASNTASQAIYGVRDYDIDTPWLQAVDYAQAVADYLIDTYKAPLKQVTTRLQRKLPDILQYELGDIITLTAPTYDIADNFRVGAIHIWTGRTMQEIFGEFKLEEIQNINEFTRQASWFNLGALTIGANKSAEFVYRGPTGTIKRADAHVQTAPTGASIICDVNINGTTIWTTQANRVTIAATETSGTQASFDTTTITDGDILTLDIDQVGAAVAGSSLTVLLEIEVPMEVA